MRASKLLDTLLAEDGLDHSAIQAVYDSLPVKAGVNLFRKKLVSSGIMEYNELMRLFINKTLLPHSYNTLEKLEKQREQRVEFKPTGHRQKFHVREEDQLVENIAFSAGDLPIDIPPPNLNNMAFSYSDEKQAVQLALDMAKSGEQNEAEIILLETLESFSDSGPAILVLCWIYLCTGHPDMLETWVKLAMEKGTRSRHLIELLCLAEQLQNKHLLATAHYQTLVRQKRVKSIWYLLLAYSQERSQCYQEAIENYRVYMTVGRDDQLKEFAKQHLQELLKS